MGFARNWDMRARLLVERLEKRNVKWDLKKIHICTYLTVIKLTIQFPSTHSALIICRLGVGLV
jgi:hypothetical protein